MKRTIASMAVVLSALFLLALSPGDSVPEISAKNQDGKIIKLSEQRGSYVLIYFYPKDDTPGCTREACNFRDEHAKLKEMKVMILGVSRQDEKSHQDFRKKYRIPFDLLVDEDGSIAKAMGVGLMPLVGFAKRQSILIDPNGKVVKFYDSVDPDKHVQEVMADVRSDRAAHTH